MDKCPTAIENRLPEILWNIDCGKVGRAESGDKKDEL